ncbi:MAG: hypothetical protein J1E04_05945 [Alistipes sp.]|nr:hypothetical protein [Alistipes sp.]
MGGVFSTFLNAAPCAVKRALPILGMAAAIMFGSCSKDNDAEQTPKFERTFIWGRNINSKLLAPIVAETADSAQVAKVILQSDGASFGGLTISNILENGVLPLIEACSPKGKAKLVYQGDIVRAGMYKDGLYAPYETYQADSATLANLGYRIVDPYYTR